MNIEFNKKIFQCYVDNIVENDSLDKIKVFKYGDEKEKHMIDLFQAPEDGIISYGTIGTYEYDIGMSLDGKSLRGEFLGVAYEDDKTFSNIISTCSFNIINSKYGFEPGLVYPNVVNMYYPDVNMKHIYLATPFIWDGEYTVDIGPYIVTWLQVLPISDAELEYIKRNGSEAFEDLLDKKEVDFLNLNRPSIV
ncbi:Suppressor of fused protein (SUFU) [Selenomonas sp. WCT3]|uniref:suppressor of fused domain protein n=1 Tax=Selenomonas sp. WCT3 TaxID=3158785 RepID=UPI000888B578|nr:Suppressor of fused protein (SUFU) [Selenomonas ruminantium]